VNHEKAIYQQRIRRRQRVRRGLRGTPERPRLTIRRSHQHIYCQIVDDSVGKTLCAASSADSQLRGQLAYGGNCAAAVAVGKEIAQRARKLGITKVCFDRGAYKYHGRVAALANAARESGIQF
jgi:large subunit ribosomal protein L18